VYSIEGKIWWRQQDEDISIVVLNSYNPDTGRFLSGAFSQLAICKDGLVCDCEAYNDIAVESHAQHGDCFHALFFEKYLVDTSRAVPELKRKIQEGLNHIGQRTVEFTGGARATTRIFHTRVDDEDPLGRFEFVHFSLQTATSRSKLVCLSNTCHHLTGAVRRDVTIDRVNELCRHNRNVALDFPELLPPAPVPPAPVPPAPVQPAAADPDGIHDAEFEEQERIEPVEADVAEVDWQSVYEPRTNEWFFHPADKGRVWRLLFEGPVFEHNVRTHRSWGYATHPSMELDDGKVVVQGPDALPFGTTCTQCGSDWTAAELVPAGYVLVRTLHAVVYREEKACVCPCGERLAWDAEVEGIFMSSPEHGLSLDVWWDYTSRRSSDFTSFVEEMHQRYQRASIQAHPFFDKGTFIKIWFRCATAFGAVMGKPPVPGCEPCLSNLDLDPLYRAPVGADATKLGPIRSNTLVTPIETPNPRAPAVPEKVNYSLYAQINNNNRAYYFLFFICSPVFVKVLRRLLRGHQRCFVPSVRDVDFPDGGLEAKVPEALARRAAYTRVLLHWAATAARGTFNDAGLSKYMLANKQASTVHAKFSALSFEQRMAFIIGNSATLEEDNDAKSILTPTLNEQTRRQLLWPLPDAARPLLLRYMLGRDHLAGRAWSVFLEILSKDDALTMLLPRKVCTLLQAWLDSGAEKRSYPAAIGDHVPALHDAIIASFSGPAVARVLDGDVLVLLRYLLIRVGDIHTAELPAVAPVLEGIEGTCNPA
jgi:hypothetical protein